MAGSVNKVIVLGNLGANLEPGHLPSGQAVCEMRVATTETYRDRNEQPQERPSGIVSSLMGQDGENAPSSCRTRSPVYVEGTAADPLLGR